MKKRKPSGNAADELRKSRLELSVTGLNGAEISAVIWPTALSASEVSAVVEWHGTELISTLVGAQGVESRLGQFLILAYAAAGPLCLPCLPVMAAHEWSVARLIMPDTFARPSSQGKPYIRYSGPELRQSDARVFLALLHMLRDVRVGTQVTMQPEPVCVALFGRYDGNSRRQLRTHIQRLQKGLIITDKYSVQLCLGFEYPNFGGWSVALDRHIVELFRVSPQAWLSIELRLRLPEGLTTWLYAFIESQTRLIPMKIARLQELCGSDSGERAFGNSLRLAMKEIARTGIIEAGWSLRRGQVRWMKKSPSYTAS